MGLECQDRVLVVLALLNCVIAWAARPDFALWWVCGSLAAELLDSHHNLSLEMLALEALVLADSKFVQPSVIQLNPGTAASKFAYVSWRCLSAALMLKR